MRLRFAIAIVALSLAAFGLAPVAHASFPGANGKIAFVRSGDIWAMNPDGSGQVNLTNDTPVQNSPAWSADGNRIAFDQDDGSNTNTYWMLADGSNRVLADDDDPYIVNRLEPAWSPAGDRIVIHNNVQDFLMTPDGTLVSGPIGGTYDPDWSADGQFISMESNQGKFCEFRRDLLVQRPDGTNFSRITSYPCDSIFTVIGNTW